MSDLFSAGASIGAAAIQSGAIKDATKMQIDALKDQRNFVYGELEPSKVASVAQQADVIRAQNRLALQSQIDPALLAARYVSEENLLKLAQEGTTSMGDVLARRLFEEVSPQDAKSQLLKEKLMDAALAEIDAGATLPADVQAELIRAGLEQSGTVGTGSSQRGLAGQLSRRLIGNEALALKQARQDQAVRLGLAAQELQNQRLGLLSGVFPQLKQLQTTNLAQQGQILGTSEATIPEAGLGGTDIANIFLARVGATNQLAQGIADANAKQALGVAQAWSQALGTTANTVAGSMKDAGVPSSGSLLATLFKK